MIGSVTPAQRLHALREGYPPAFWVLWFGTLLNRLGEFVAPLLGFYLTAEKGFSLTQVGVILSAVGVGRFFAESLGGGLSDRVGSGVTMQLALAGGAVILALLAHAGSFWEILLGVLAYSLFQAMYKPAVSSAVAGLTHGAQRTRAYNLLYWAINVGASVAPVLGGYLAGASFRLVFYLDAAAMLLYAALLRWRFPNVRPGRSASTESQRWLPRDALLWQFSLATLLYSLTYQGYKMLALVFADGGYTPAQYGQVLAVNGVLVVLLGLPVGHLIARSNHPRWQAIGAAMLGLGFFGHAFADTLWAHMGAVVVWTLGEIVAYSISKTVISELARPEQRGQYFGIVGSMSGLAGLIAPLLGTALLEHYGAAPMWTALAALGWAAAAIYLLLEGRVEQRRSAITALDG